MCQTDIDNNNQIEQTRSPNLLIYAIDEHGICHVFKNEKFNQLQTISIDTNNMINEEDISNLIVALLNQIDNSLQLTNKILIQNSSNLQTVEYLSTQPFSIFDLHENNISSLHLFNNDISIPILSPPSQFSGKISSQYHNNTLNNTNNHILKIKNKKKKLRYYSRQFNILKKKLKTYVKRKKQQQHHLNNISKVIVHHQTEHIESTSIEHSTMIDFQLLPDLSKRKYIYKDITSSNNNQNQTNLRIFQCTQQQSSISCLDQSITNDHNYHPYHFPNNRISLPDIRIGLSRHHTMKQLHKIIID